MDRTHRLALLLSAWCGPMLSGTLLFYGRTCFTLAGGLQGEMKEVEWWNIYPLLILVSLIIDMPPTALVRWAFEKNRVREIRRELAESRRAVSRDHNMAANGSRLSDDGSSLDASTAASQTCWRLPRWFWVVPWLLCALQTTVSLVVPFVMTSKGYLDTRADVEGSPCTCSIGKNRDTVAEWVLVLMSIELYWIFVSRPFFVLVGVICKRCLSRHSGRLSLKRWSRRRKTGEARANAVEMTTNSAATHGGRDELVTNPMRSSRNKKRTSSLHSADGGWTTHVDPKTGHQYRHHSSSGATEWVKNDESGTIERASSRQSTDLDDVMPLREDNPMRSSRNKKKKKKRTSSRHSADGAWTTHVDPKTGHQYRHHSSSGATEWVKNDESGTIEKASSRQSIDLDDVKPLREDSGWTMHTDPLTGRRYRHHPSSGSTEWV